MYSVVNDGLFSKLVFKCKRLPLQSKMLLEASAFSDTKLSYKSFAFSLIVKVDLEIIVGLFSCVKEKLSIPSRTFGCESNKGSF